ERCGADCLERVGRDRAESRDHRIMMDQQAPVGSRMDVELDTVRPEADGLPEGGQGILQGVPGGAAVGQDPRGGRRHGLGVPGRIWRSHTRCGIVSDCGPYAYQIRQHACTLSKTGTLNQACGPASFSLLSLRGGIGRLARRRHQLNVGPMVASSQRPMRAMSEDSPRSDAALVAAYRSGDEAAAAELVYRHGSALGRYL